MICTIRSNYHRECKPTNGTLWSGIPDKLDAAFIDQKGIQQKFNNVNKFDNCHSSDLHEKMFTVGQ